MRRLVLCLALLMPLACGDDDKVTSEEQAEQAYLGLEQMIDRAMDLGFQGYNAATSANIPAQSASGDVSGTITVAGKVDQGASNNKEMELSLALVDYADREPDKRPLTYNTAAPLPSLGLSLKNIPDGTLTGTLNGTFSMSGALKGDVTLALSITAELEPVPTDTTKVQRKAGTITVTGTATSDYGVYDVDLQL